jgi:hypothetical protein
VRQFVLLAQQECSPFCPKHTPFPPHKVSLDLTLMPGVTVAAQLCPQDSFLLNVTAPTIRLVCPTALTKPSRHKSYMTSWAFPSLLALALGTYFKCLIYSERSSVSHLFSRLTGLNEWVYIVSSPFCLPQLIIFLLPLQICLIPLSPPQV